MSKFNFFLICCSFIFIHCDTSYKTIAYSQDTNRVPANLNMEPGKCYAKCLIPDVYGLEKTDYFIFTGDAIQENVATKEVTLELTPAATRWEKKRSTNCRSSNPDDCLVWCLVEVPAQTETFTVLLDTTSSANYELKTVVKKVLESKGGHTEYREVICGGQISNAFIEELRGSLQLEGYAPGDAPRLDTQFKSALSQYQKDHGLPVGNLDVETLAALGIDF